MDIPLAFKRLGDRLYQGIDREAQSLDQLATHLAAKEASDRQELRRFLEDLVSPRTNAEEIASVMNSVCNSYYFHDGEEARSLLKLVLAKL